jgi:hypothetical protein
MSVLKKLKSRAACMKYALPGGPNDVICIPMSGGADSTAMAILILTLFPEIKDKVVFVFTDTEAECAGVYDSLDRVEQYLGVTINRVHHPIGLWGLIEKFNGFLPSSAQRYCTPQLKLKPFEKFMKGLVPEDGKVYALVGIRADESTRLGRISKDDRIVTETPYVDLKIGREEVYAILNETIGVPGFYRNRTRSGCSACWGMRLSEVVGTFRWARKDFDLGAAVEKLSPEDLKRYSRKAVAVKDETGIAENHLAFPRPTRWDAKYGRGSRTKDGLGTLDLLSSGTVDVFVGVEFMVHGGVGGDGVWWQDIVSFSTTRSGISRQLANHYWHRLNTAEVWGLTQQEMEAELKLVVYQIELPAHLVDIGKPSDETYAWRSGSTFAQVEHIVGWAARALQVEGLHQEARRMMTANVGEHRMEQYAELMERVRRIKSESGRIVTLEVYEPPASEPEVEEAEVTCLICSL